MIFSDSVKRYLSLTLVISLLAVLALTVTGCEEFGFPPPEPPAPEEETKEQAPPPTTPPTTITSEDRAILSVYEHLLSQAESYTAKAYLADFYAASDRWRARSELFKDGTSIWYVVVDMTGVVVWEERNYWQLAGWFVLQDGKVIPSNRLQANALRIEADLQELSLQTNVTQEETTESDIEPGED